MVSSQTSTNAATAFTLKAIVTTKLDIRNRKKYKFPTKVDFQIRKRKGFLVKGNSCFKVENH